MKKMPRRRAEKGAANSPNIIRLQNPDRSPPDPTRETLLDIAEKRGLLKDGESVLDDGGHADPEEEVDAPIGRFGEAVLWSISLAMLHFTLDVLAQHQYAANISWWSITAKSLQAFAVILLLFYTLHPNPNPSIFDLHLPSRYQSLLHQLVFFAGSMSAGCYLIYITNEYGSYAIMKRAPPVGCLWIWSVIELDIRWALISVLCCFAFLWRGGYSYI